jgi:hypothetical protein
MDDLAPNDISLILDVDMNANMSIETHITYNKPLIFYGKVIEGLI